MIVRVMRGVSHAIVLAASIAGPHSPYASPYYSPYYTPHYSPAAYPVQEPHKPSKPSKPYPKPHPEPHPNPPPKPTKCPEIEYDCPLDGADQCPLHASCKPACVPKFCLLPEDPHKIQGYDPQVGEHYVKLGSVCVSCMSLARLLWRCVSS